MNWPSDPDSCCNIPPPLHLFQWRRRVFESGGGITKQGSSKAWRAAVWGPKKLCSRHSSSEVRFFTQIGRFAFLRPPLGDLGATYDDRLRLIGKRMVDFGVRHDINTSNSELQSTAQLYSQPISWLVVCVKLWTHYGLELKLFTSFSAGCSISLGVPPWPSRLRGPWSRC